MLLVIISRNLKRLNWLIIFPLIYTLQESWFFFNRFIYDDLSDLRFLYLVTPLFLYCSFTQFYLTIENFRFLFYSAMVFAAAVIIKTFLNFSFVILSQVYTGMNFNYLFLSYNLLSLYLMGLLILYKYKNYFLYSQLFFILSIEVLTSLWVIGSRGAISIFFITFIFALLMLFNKKMVLITLTATFSFLLFLIFVSHNAILLRYDFFNLINDQSLQDRIFFFNTSKQIFDVNFSKILFGLKLTNPQNVVLIGYDHSILEVIRNNGLVFLISILWILLYKLFVLGGWRFMFLFFLPILGSFIILSDLFILIWAYLGFVSIRHPGLAPPRLRRKDICLRT